MDFTSLQFVDVTRTFGRRRAQDLEIDVSTDHRRDFEQAARPDWQTIEPAAHVFLHAARDFVRIKVLISLESHCVQEFRGAGFGRLAGDTFAFLQGEKQVFLAGEGVEERVFLEKHADVRAFEAYGARVSRN